MKITDVRTHILRKAYDPEKYGASSKGWIRDRASLLVQVLTDEGIEGWGEGGQTGPSRQRVRRSTPRRATV